MFTRPSLCEIYSVLAEHKALIVHFSGTPKGSGSGFEDSFPSDLKKVIAGRSQTGISCSTVMPGDEFRDLCRANATGCIGVILTLLAPDSVMDAHPADCGSYVEDGVRKVPKARDMTKSELEATISKRAQDSYNEWVIARYKVIGLFAADPYRVSAQVNIDYPVDMPDYLRSNDATPVFKYKTLEEIESLFPDLPIYAFSGGGVVKRDGSTWVSVAHATLYC